MIIVLDGAALVPPMWADGNPAQCHVFNPAIVRVRGRLVMAYRVVPPGGSRRIAVCELDAASLRPRSETIVPLSDLIQSGGEWHADPRFCVLGERLYLHYNDGGLPGNRIYLLEVDPNSLTPLGPARPLVLDGPRRPVEKNWLLFEHHSGLLAVYSIVPHTVMRIELKESGPVMCRRMMETPWDATTYSRRYGQPRGGTPPVAVDGVYYTFFHSCYHVDRLRRMLNRLLRRPLQHTLQYVAGCYGFRAAPTFQPALITRAPILTPGAHLPRRRLPQLDARVRAVVYPTGAVWSAGEWIVSFGADNEHCCLTTIAHTDLVTGCSRTGL